MKKKESIYVYLGRFSPFHHGHNKLMDTMIARFGEKNCLVMIGSSDSLNHRTPFTYEDRKTMIRAIYPGIKIIPLPDVNPALEHFDDNTNSIWLDRLEKIEKEVGRKFIFVGGCKEDLRILAERFPTRIPVDRTSVENPGSATKIRNALESNDRKTLEKGLDPRVLPIVENSYQKYLSWNK